MYRFSVVLLAVSSFAFAQTEGSVAGKWKVTASIGGNASTSECTFIQKAKDLSGSCKDERGTKDLTGKVDGETINWSISSEYNGNPLTIKYSGKLKDGKIAGEATVDPFSISGDFTAEPVK